MTISGMTGFARAEGEHEGQRWIWEVRSVNGRALDLKLRTPSGFDALEQPARAAAAKRFKRGSVQANLSLSRDPSAAPPLKFDMARVERLLEAGAPLIEAKRVRKPAWDGLLAVRGVVQTEDNGLDPEARQAVGRMLLGVLSELADRLDELIAAARASAATAPAAALDRIRQRLEQLAPEIKLDPQRLAQEAALAAMRADVQEELERLAAHAAELRGLITKPEPAGRRLDFLSQELTREANTLVSKSSDMALTRIGLDLKAVVDQIKEQAANVE